MLSIPLSKLLQGLFCYSLLIPAATVYWQYQCCGSTETLSIFVFHLYFDRLLWHQLHGCMLIKPL